MQPEHTSGKTTRQLLPAIKTTMRGLLLSLVCLSLVGCNSSDDDEPSDDQAVDMPGAVGNLEGYVYTESEAAIFWDAASDDGVVTGYDIWRNDEPVAVELDALNWRDASLVPLTDYVFEVAAVNDEGQRGPRSQVELSTPALQPTLNSDNYSEIVGYVLSLYERASYDIGYLGLYQYYFDNDPEFDDPLIVQATYDCPNEGTGQANVQRNDTNAVTQLEFLFMECEWRDRVYEGDATIEHSSLFGPRGQGSDAYAFDELSVTDASGQQTLATGSLVDVLIACRHGPDYQSWQNSLSSLVTRDRRGDTVLTNIDTKTLYGFKGCTFPAVAELSGSLSVRSQSTGNKTLQVDTPVPLSNPAEASRKFTTGTLRISAEDGSLIELRADEGDTDTVGISLTVHGSVESFPVPWDTWVTQ